MPKIIRLPLSLVWFVVLCSCGIRIISSFQIRSTRLGTSPLYDHQHKRSISRRFRLKEKSSTNDSGELLSLNHNRLEKFLEMAIKSVGTSTTVVVASTFFVVLAYKRDAMMVSFFIGSIANGILSKILKKLINQTRPAELKDADMNLKPNDNGMPSSHAMSLGFICTFVALNLPQTKIPLALYALISLMYRVDVKLHTWQQVLVGSIVGTLNGCVWFRLCVGDNPWNVNIMQYVTRNFLNEQELLPAPMLLVPVIVGTATIGSVERRLSNWMKKKE